MICFSSFFSAAPAAVEPAFDIAKAISFLWRSYKFIYAGSGFRSIDVGSTFDHGVLLGFFAR